jgi:hypothetical protein
VITVKEPDKKGLENLAEALTKRMEDEREVAGVGWGNGILEFV